MVPSSTLPIRNEEMSNCFLVGQVVDILFCKSPLTIPELGHCIAILRGMYLQVFTSRFWNAPQIFRICRFRALWRRLVETGPSLQTPQLSIRSTQACSLDFFYGSAFLHLWSAVLEEGFPFWCCCSFWAKKNKVARVFHGLGLIFRCSVLQAVSFNCSPKLSYRV